MAMCHLLGAPGTHNPGRVFHTMQAHLHARPPLGPCGPGACGPPWVLVGWALVGLALVSPPGPLWAGSLGGPVGRALVGPLGPCGPSPRGPPESFWAMPLRAPWALMGQALVGPPGPS